MLATFWFVATRQAARGVQVGLVADGSLHIAPPEIVCRQALTLRGCRVRESPKFGLLKPTSDTVPAVTVKGPSPILLDLSLHSAPRRDISQGGARQSCKNHSCNMQGVPT